MRESSPEALRGRVFLGGRRCSVSCCGDVGGSRLRARAGRRAWGGRPGASRLWPPRLVRERLRRASISPSASSCPSSTCPRREGCGAPEGVCALLTAGRAGPLSGSNAGPRLPAAQAASSLPPCAGLASERLMMRAAGRDSNAHSRPFQQREEPVWTRRFASALLWTRVGRLGGDRRLKPPRWLWVRHMPWWTTLLPCCRALSGAEGYGSIDSLQLSAHRFGLFRATRERPGRSLEFADSADTSTEAGVSADAQSLHKGTKCQHHS